MVLDELKQELEFREKQYNVDKLNPKYHNTTSTLRTQLTLNQNKENNNVLMLAVEKLTTIVAVLKEDNHTLEDQVTMLENENAELTIKHAKTQSVLETQHSLVNEQDRLFARNEDFVLAQWSEPEPRVKVEDTTKCPQAGALVQVSVNQLIFIHFNTQQESILHTSNICEIQEGSTQQHFSLSEGKWGDVTFL